MHTNELDGACTMSKTAKEKKDRIKMNAVPLVTSEDCVLSCQDISEFQFICWRVLEKTFLRQR